MSDLSPALETALSADIVTIFGALQIDFPAATLRLIDGAGTVEIGGQPFVGRDDTFGVLAAVDAIDDGMGDQAPAISLTLHPANDAAVADLSAANMQGSRVRLWLGAVTRATGAVIDTHLLFDGELDVPLLTVGQSERTLEYECVSGFERLFENDEGNRLSDTFHKSIWPGEEGLEHITGIIRLIYWGVPKP